MIAMEFLEAKNTDLLKEVARLADAIWREHYIPIIGREQVEYMLGKFQSLPAITKQIEDGYLYYLIRDDQKAYIGYFGVLVQGQELFLSKIYLRSDVRGKGWGRETLYFIEGLAKGQTCSKIWLTVNKNNSGAIEAYQKCGYTITGALVQDIGRGFVMDDYKLEKSL